MLVNNENEKKEEIDKFKKEFSSTGNINRALILKFKDGWYIYGFDDKSSFKEVELGQNDDLSVELDKPEPKNKNKIIERVTSKLSHTPIIGLLIFFK